jgi:GntR family transcriptional repressor for pyruvate dehydrogenase complex
MRNATERIDEHKESRLIFDTGSGKQPTRIQIVLQYIKDCISDGTFPPGSKLPTENEIAETLGVSRTPVREAVKILEALGLLDVRVGSGTYLRVGLERSLSHVLMLQLSLHKTTPKKLMEARRIVERGCAELAAERRTEDDLAQMRASIEALESCTNRHDATPNEMLEADLQFHRVVFQATKNELVAAFANFVLDMVAPWVGRSLENTDPMQAVYNHKLEYSMIEAGNAGAARESVVLTAVDAGMDHWRSSLEREATNPERE